MMFGGNQTKSHPETTSNGQPLKASKAAGEGEGYEMGSGRGRGRDGAGTYEMVGMALKEAA